MERLNYHHLLYFWTVVREGGISKASEKLQLSQPTISGQIRLLEQSLGQKLFRRVGRGLAITEFGDTVFRYSEEIFRIGHELTETVHGRPVERQTRFAVGISDEVPALLAQRLLEPVLRGEEDVQLLYKQGGRDSLVAALASKNLDLVISSAPVSPSSNVRAFSHKLGECGYSVFGTKRLASKVQRGFPKSLNGAPMLLPRDGGDGRRKLNQWFASQRVTPRSVAELDGCDVAAGFGGLGVGLFLAPSAVEKEMTRLYPVQVAGRISRIREPYFAISLERKLRNPLALAIVQAGRKLFR